MFFCLLIHLPVQKQGKINNPDKSQTNSIHYWESYSNSTDLHGMLCHHDLQDFLKFLGTFLIFFNSYFLYT